MRVLGLEYHSAADLVPHPLNYRTHDSHQANVMRDILGEIGFAGAIIGRRKGDQVEILNGHLRAQLAADEKVPVLLVDLDDTEAAKFLATHDTVGNLAGIDAENLKLLSETFATESQAIQLMLDTLRFASGEEKEVEAPEDFKSYDEQLPTDHECPKCGYKWS